MSFQAAADEIKNKGKDLNLSDESKLKLYSLYKQATVGDNNTDKPAFYQLEAKAKWNAWDGQKGKKKEVAETEYIALVRSLVDKK